MKNKVNTTIKSNIELYEEIEGLEKGKQVVVEEHNEAINELEAEMSTNKSNLEKLKRLRDIQTEKIRESKLTNEARLYKMESQAMILENEMKVLRNKISKGGPLGALEEEINYYNGKIKLNENILTVLKHRQLEITESVGLLNSETLKSNTDVLALRIKIEQFQKDLDCYVIRSDVPRAFDFQYRSIDKFKLVEVLIDKFAFADKIKLLSDLCLKILNISNISDLFKQFAIEFNLYAIDSNAKDIINIMKIAINLLYNQSMLNMRLRVAEKNRPRIKELNDLGSTYMEKLYKIEKRKGSYERIRNTLLRSKVELMKQAGAGSADIERLNELEARLSDLKAEEEKIRVLISRVSNDLEHVNREINNLKVRNDTIKLGIKGYRDKINETNVKSEQEIIKRKLNINENNMFLKDCIENKQAVDSEMSIRSDKQSVRSGSNIWSSKINKLRGSRGNKEISRINIADDACTSDEEEQLKHNLINDSITSAGQYDKYSIVHNSNVIDLAEDGETNNRKKSRLGSSNYFNGSNNYSTDSPTPNDADKSSTNKRIFSFGNASNNDSKRLSEEDSIFANSKAGSSYKGSDIVKSDGNINLNIKDLQYPHGITPDQVIFVYNKSSLMDDGKNINSILTSVKQVQIESTGVKEPKGSVKSFIPKREINYDKSYDKIYEKSVDNHNDNRFNFKPLSLKYGNRDNISSFGDTNKFKGTGRNKSISDYSDRSVNVSMLVNSSYVKHKQTDRSSQDNTGSQIKSHNIPLSLKDSDSRMTNTNSIGFRYENTSKQEFLLAEKLYPLLEGIKLYERNIILSRPFEEYTIVYKGKPQRPEEHNFKQYFCYIDRDMKKLVLNNVNKDDKNREIYLTSIKKLGVPQVTKNLIFLVQMYKKIRAEEIPDSQIVNYMKSKGCEKYKKLYNAPIDINLFDEEYRDGVYKSKFFLLYVYLKEETRLELIFNDYEDYKHWINGLEEVRNRVAGKGNLEIIRKKIV
jgi:hypothetical protein